MEEATVIWVADVLGIELLVAIDQLTRVP